MSQNKMPLPQGSPVVSTQKSHHLGREDGRMGPKHGLGGDIRLQKLQVYKSRPGVVRSNKKMNRKDRREFLNRASIRDNSRDIGRRGRIAGRLHGECNRRSFIPLCDGPPITIHKKKQKILSYHHTSHTSHTITNGTSRCWPTSLTSTQQQVNTYISEHRNCRRNSHQKNIFLPPRKVQKMRSSSPAVNKLLLRLTLQ